MIERQGPRDAGAASPRSAAADPARLPLAEVDALGRGLDQARRAALGAAAALDPLHLRRPDTKRRRSCRFALDGVASGDIDATAIASWRPAPIKVRRFDDYVAALLKAKVVLDADRRKAIILADAKSLAFAQGLELVEDEGLLDEVAGPRRMAGRADGRVRGGVPRHPARSDPRDHPRQPEMLRAARRRTASSPTSSSSSPTSWRATAARRSRPATRASCGRGSPTRATSGRPISPSCPTTRQGEKPLDQRLAKLKALGIVFHEKLGTQGERVERIAALARALAPPVGCVPELAERAARLAKADLVTEMVGEFPELQGLMGRYYAAAQGEDVSVAAGDRGALQAAGAGRPRADRAGVDRGGARRQARHAGRLLGDRREADRQQGPLCAAARGAGRDPDRAGERAAAAARFRSPSRQSRSLGAADRSSAARLAIAATRWTGATRRSVEVETRRMLRRSATAISMRARSTSSPSSPTA